MTDMDIADHLDTWQRTIQNEIQRRAGNPDKLQEVMDWLRAWRVAITSDVPADLEPLLGNSWRAAVTRIATADAPMEDRLGHLQRAERFVRTVQGVHHENERDGLDDRATELAGG